MTVIRKMITNLLYMFMKTQILVEINLETLKNNQEISNIIQIVLQVEQHLTGTFIQNVIVFLKILQHVWCLRKKLLDFVFKNIF